MTDISDEKDIKKRSILDLPSDEARVFFLKEDSYNNLDLPPYFRFSNLLDELDAFLSGKTLSDLQSKKPKDCDGINYQLVNNKDGKYAWRPMDLIHPILYVSLVHKITGQENWYFICERIQSFRQNHNIKCLSLPVESLSDETDKAEQIAEWWHTVEQRSIELALEYEYLFHTDISDCYGSIYTHSISWALHTKEEAKKPENKNNSELVGVAIDKTIQDMSYGQTNGIPQGSILCDFIAEMVLGYADLLLSERIDDSITDYQVLRYRDDYRVFVNNPKDGEKIIKFLTEIMIDLGMKLNPSKTSFSNQVISSSIKQDKLSWLYRKHSSKDLQQHLLIIHDHAADFPNSGSLTKALLSFYKRLSKLDKAIDSLMVLISISTDIAYHNPKIYPVISAILSKLIVLLNDEGLQLEVIEKIQIRFSQIPNTGYMEIWLQRFSWFIKEDIEYSEPLCQLLAGSPMEIWNIDWISCTELKDIMKPSKIIDSSILTELTPTIDIGEIELFEGYH
jgi:hypothetical protein